MKNIISFSLWGENPMYWVGARRNIDLAKKYYPGWVCRFYIDKDCDTLLIDSIIDTNVDIVLMESKKELVSNTEKFNHSGLFWRFLVLFDDYDTVIFRDCDSRISEREVTAVNEWLESDKNFHIMRDHPYHTVPILTGMWGCKKNSTINIKNLFEQWSKYLYKGKWSAEDQDFLGQILYPLTIGDSIEHSEFGIRFGSEIRNFPFTRVNNEYVGDVFDENDMRHPEYWKLI